MFDLNRVVLTDTPLECPFASKEKRWIAAAISAVAALGSAILGSASNNSTNNTNAELNDKNLDMQRETNELNATLQRETNNQNYKQFQEQNAFNLDMWNKQNQYNTPAQQVQRMLAAGINPASGFGKTSDASSISSSVGAPSVAPQLQAPKNMFSMRPTDWSGMSDAGQGAVNAYNQSRMMAAETKNKEALTANTAMDTTLKSKSMQDNLKILHQQAKGSGWQAEMAKKQLDFINATMDYDIKMKYGDMMMQQKSFERLEKEMRYQDLQNDILEITKGYAHQLNNAQIASLWSTVHKANAEVGLINANRLLTDEQRMHEVEKKVGTIIDNGLKSLNLNIQKDAKQAILQSYMNNANEGMWRAFDAWKHTPNGNNRSTGDQFSIDFLKDFMERRFKSAGYKPKFAFP